MNLNFFDDNCCEIHCCDGTDFDFPTTNPTIPVLNHCVDVTRRVPVKGVWSWRFLVHFCDAGDPSRCMIPLVVYSADKQVFKNHAQLLNLLLSWRLHEKKRLRIKDKRASVWSEGVLEGTLQSVDRAKDVSNDYTGRIWKGLISIHGEGFVSPDFEDEVIFNIEVYNMQTNIRERCETDIQRCITLDEDTMDGQVDAALMSMKKGEEAEFCMTQKVYDPSCTGGEQVSSYRCILRLRSFLHISSIDFGFEERVQQGCRRKLEGNDFFRAKKYMSALHKYRRALDFFRADPSASLHCPEVEQKRILTKSQTHNNIALVILVAYGSHLDLDEALEHCNKSINLIPCPLQNDKAFLRRGAIHRTKLNFALAYKDIAVVLEKNPKHTDALREREALLRVEQDTNNQDKKFYAAMMNRLGIQNKKLEADSVSSARRKGVCKAWICKRLCGILNDGVSDYPCNASEIVTQRPIRVLEVGCEVEFGVSTDEVSGEKRAVHVTLPGGEPLPGTDYDTSDRRSGFVVLWDKDRNFGFIRDEIKGEDLFVHVQNVLAFEHPKKVLHVGEPVEYECETDRNGRKRAVRVTAPDGLPVFGAPDSQQSRITIQEALTTRRRHFGLCVKWNPDRRFGFINDEVLGKDIFVHASNLHSTTESQLQLGQRVEYGLEERKDGKLAAIDVRIVEGVHSEACETLNSDQTPFIIHNANCE